MRSLTDLSLREKKVIVRVDFNVPIDDNFKIIDDRRILAAIPTIKLLIKKGAKVILMSHLGRPKNGPENNFSLKHIVSRLSNILNTPILFSNDCIGNEVQNTVNGLDGGEVLLLENLRFYSQEKDGDVEFAKQLANLADVYVNDAFGAAHRAHASTSIIAQFFPENKFFGLLLKNELDCLKKALYSAKRPFTAIIGGAKITGKIDLITALFDKVDNLIVGGGMAYTFAKAIGGNIGKSLVENKKIPLAKNLVDEAKNKGVNLILPTDSVNADNFSNDAELHVSSIKKIDSNYIGLDIGPESIRSFSEIILNSKTIIWNGPMGVFEMSNFESGTKEIANAICLATERGGFSLVGGGDSVAAIKQFGLVRKVSYLSTGGGAMLKYLEGKKLPGVEAILS